MKHFLEILFPDDVRPGDIEIIHLASASEPGTARLLKATTGQPDPNAPNSAPVYSGSGPKIGFVAEAGLLEAPYTHAYWLEDDHDD